MHKRVYNEYRFVPKICTKNTDFGHKSRIGTLPTNKRCGFRAAHSSYKREYKFAHNLDDVLPINLGHSSAAVKRWDWCPST